MKTPKTPIRKLAYKESLARLPETCPSVRSVGVLETAKAHKWLHRQAWFQRLSFKQRLALETSYGIVAQGVCDGVRDAATLPMREVLVDLIEERLRSTLSAERLAQIEAGQDQAALLVHGA